MSGTLYDRDFYQWTQENAGLLRDGKAAHADLAHVAGEIEDMGKRDRRAAISHTRVLILHLLKWTLQPEKRSSSSIATINEQRRKLRLLLNDSPSLETILREQLGEIACDAAHDAAQEIGLPLPAGETWPLAKILNPDFWPE